MKTTLLILLCALWLILVLNPRIDKTKEGYVVLWYGERIRKYIILFKTKPDED